MQDESIYVRVLCDHPSVNTGSEATVLQSLATKKREVSHAVMEQVIHSIEVNDMMTSMKTLANERLVTSGREKHSYNLYRDLLFLTFAALGRDNIDQGE